MAAPVWVLSVDLQAKTATFQSGLADAARAARSSFADIGDAARAGSNRVVEGTTDVRHSLGLMDNAIRGNHAAAMVDLIRLMQNSSIVMAALPFAGVIGGFLLFGSAIVGVVRHFQELKAEEEKLRDAQTNLGTSIQDVFNALDVKLLQAQKRADELANNHLGALHDELELINKASLEELRKSFDAVVKDADSFLEKLKASWYEIGSGSAGAQHALGEFKTQYESLLSQGKDKEASGLLHGTLAQAQDVLKLQKEAASTKGPGEFTDTSYAAQIKLHQENIGYTTKEIQSQEALVQALEATVGVEARIAKLKGDESKNATRQNSNETAARESEAARTAAEGMLRMGQTSLAADKATAEAGLTIKRASLEERLQTELEFIGRERDVQVAANQAEVAALDKYDKTYLNQVKALHEKALEIETEYDAKTAEARAKSSVDVANRDLQAFETGEREKIEATSKGEAARVAAIDAAIHDAQAKNLQDTQFYRELLVQRTEAVRQQTEEEKKLRAEAAREDADNTQKMGELALAAEKQRTTLADSARRVTIQQRIAEDVRFADEEYQIKMDAVAKEIAGLEASDREYLNRLKALQDKELQLTREHENELAGIRERATEQTNQNILSSYQHLVAETSRDLTQVIMGHETFARMITNLGDQVVSGMLENAVKSALMLDMNKEKEAAEAARWGFLTGMKLPFPANIAAAPVLAAGAFASVMAYSQGTDFVPGIGKGDHVPAMLEPGEGIVPGGVMDGLRHVARNGGFNNAGPRNTVHMHVAYHVNTIDGDGMADTLEKHGDQLLDHVQRALRRMHH